MDAYDHMVAYLTENPEEIYEAWNSPSGHRAGALFAPLGSGCAVCLTQLRKTYDGDYFYETGGLEIAKAIRSDERLPDNGRAITPNHLPIFAGWQRRVNRELKRTPPVWSGPPIAAPEVDMGPSEPVGVCEREAVAV